MVSRRLSPEELSQNIKADPDFDTNDPAGILDYSHLLSQVEVKIKIEPPEYEETVGLSEWINSNLHHRAANSLYLQPYQQHFLKKYLDIASVVTASVPWI